MEIDVRVSGDGVLYLFHDGKIKDKKIKGLSFQDLVDLDDSIFKLESIFNLKIPEGYYLLDLKDDDHSLVEHIKTLLLSVDFPKNKIAFQSNSLELLKSLKRELPDTRVIFILELKRKFPWIKKPSVSKLIRMLNENNISMVNIKEKGFINKKFIKDFKDNDIKVLIWNVNDLQRIKYYKEIGVEGVVTDIIHKCKNLFAK